MDRFDQVIAQMRPLLERLTNSFPYRGEALSHLPVKGVYVFYEQGKPMYVGRVFRQSIRSRIGQHTRPSSGHNQAVFAFKLLQEQLNFEAGHGAPWTRAEAADFFAEQYREQKQRVRDMDVRAVEIEDALTQVLFEIYAVLALGTTRYNSFETS